ncbi:hypothetical protein GALMADRAFT_235956 [Galerina marginata CBS 339.88]|uniref:FMP27 GFWDK domain-containing protein n=1 Tax=Galerina marginata (strain CBS 339.88) TaxID=685588 RepID=A0A067TK93_GALM3|nr:hypothetical protein GALMADRAFT_235956 [Galerina marginata CBS 339.88]
MSFSMLYQPIRPLIVLLSFLFISTPNNALSTSAIIWIVRIVTFSLLLRTYFLPWFLALMSDHIRVRSVSLRSIRGLYFRRGARTWRAERVSYIFSPVEGSRHFTVKIDGASLHIAKDDDREATKTPRRHNRNLTLADLNPSPLARYAWRVFSTITGVLEPYLRPLIRTYVIGCLRIGLQWLPKLTQALSFDLKSVVVTFEEVPGAKVVTEAVILHAALALTHLEPTPESDEAERVTSRPKARPIYGVGVWKKRLTESFQRSLDKALGESRGTASLSLKMSNVLGTVPRSSQISSLDMPFLSSPGTIDLSISAKFNPKEGAIETRGLEISLRMGDCLAKVDLINLLLEKAIPKKTQTVPIIHPPLSPVSAYGETPLASSFMLTSPQPAVFYASGKSFASSLFPSTSMFSPSSILSPKSLLSPNSALPLSPRLPRSPSSPFFKAISASIRPRHRFLVQPPAKLKEFRDRSKFLILCSVQVSVASISLSVLSETDSGPYKAVVNNIGLDLSVSDPSRNELHKTHLGSRENTEVYDSNAYALKLTMHQVTLERESKHHIMRLARTGSIELQVLATQWPIRLPTPFMSNDANAPLLAVHFKMANLHLTDRMHDLHRLLNKMPTMQKQTEEPPSPIRPTVRLGSFPIPRLSIALECGPIIARIIYDADKGEKHRAVELRNNGCAISLNARYMHPSLAIGRLFPAASSVQPLQWSSTLSMTLEPVLVRVRSKHNFIGFGDSIPQASDEDFLDDPPLLSIGMVEISASANAVAQMDGHAESMAIVDASTLIGDISLAFETICVELWHPIAVDAAFRLLSLPQPKVAKAASTNPPPLFSPLPLGLFGKVAVARFVVFVTAPDISPNDNLDLSRGFALSTSTSLEYSSLLPNQGHWLDNRRRSQKRAQLGLPMESVTDALVDATATSHPGDGSAFLKMRFSKLVFRAAVATQYEPDEPDIVGRNDISDRSQEFLRIDNSEIDIRLTCKMSADHLPPVDICDISLHIPLLQFDFRLAFVYNILLGLQTIRLINPPRPAPIPDPVDQSRSKVVLTLQGNLTTILGNVSLPRQELVVRIDGLSGNMVSSKTPRLKWTRATVFVSLPPKMNRWEEATKGKWDELITLQSLEISFIRLAGSLCISVDGDSARIRIPHGFILADLVQDASVSAKAIKHMAHMASAGCYSDMPSPEPEGPKAVPHLTIRMGWLCVEAQDDPFEAKLGLIWTTGVEAVKQRMDREDAFKAKVAAVLSAEPELSPSNPTNTDPGTEYQFNAKHSVSIQEARRRLDDVHALDWTLRLERSRNRRSKEEESVLHKLYGTSMPPTPDPLLEFMSVPNTSCDPPLFRAMLQDLCLTISPPSFSVDQLADVLHNLGNGLPRDTRFSLLVPLHIHFTLSSLHVTLRDYPLPLFGFSAQQPSSKISWTFDTDLIVGEEMGTALSVDWVTCPIIESRQARHGEAPFSILVPKTIMPVKTYAAPIIKITTPEPTTFAWGVSYGPAIQDLMRIVETLSSSPRDSSPAVGFWDKMRLVLHWTVKVTFVGDVRLYMKGSRDPYETFDAGAGFVLCWQGNPEIRVGYENQQKELIQVMSDGMLIAVPNLKNGLVSRNESSQKDKPFLKVCARLTSGVRYGIGFILERACGPECLYCMGSTFHRKCRYFSFRPHYDVKLEKKPSMPSFKAQGDSYNGFRSDFIHLSVSLASSTKTKGQKISLKPSNLYLTPKIFAHFWSWCSLFDGVLTLPIRQGNYHPSRPISPKLGRHLATLKYRISLPHLYFLHGYIDDARETWVDGVTPWVGLKGKVDEFQADMHQREEETTVPGPIPNTTRVVRKKPFYAAEVIMKGIELRAMLATFPEVKKQNAEMTAPPQRSNYRKHTDLPVTPSTSIWYDMDDFVELDWSSMEQPTLCLLPLASCPHFTFFKRNEALSGSHPQPSKFGSEHSHICLLGKEPSVPKTQISLANARAMELRQFAQNESSSGGKNSSTAANPKSAMKMVTLLEDYIAVLKEVEIKPDSTQAKAAQSYHMPADIVSSDEWAEFDNVYQIHCPSIFMDSAVRDVMMQYYYCSRDRRGFEYHMATRAVKFIRDQANVALAGDREAESVKDRSPTNTAQLAASALRKMLKGDNGTKISVDVIRDKNEVPGKIEPLDGWPEGVSLQKSHCCLLLKPQIVLRGETSGDTLVVAAAQAKLQSFAIMDLLNFDDPVSGKVMSRNYTSLSGLQAFAPTNVGTSNGSVPLEVLIDLRCESDAFERLVPQTEATFHYDKFNRLRLRNNITSIVSKASTDTQNSSSVSDSHLQDQTDLIRVHIPRFTVSANAEHFQAISNIVTKLLLFSDPAHKTRLDKLETLIFTYDFADLASAAGVVSNLQCRLRDALETERLTRRSSRHEEDEDSRLAFLQLKAHIFLLSEELNLLFDSIKMAQDRFDDQTDQKSALLLHASSSEISWRMLDARRNLLSKLVVAKINFHWLSRQDSSTVNHLIIGNLSAFDGSRYAMWTEILSKYDDPPNHPLLKRGLFLSANWTVLAPVGGITIYEAFELSLHPLRLQIDAKVGRRIMEYVWPDRKNRETSVEYSPDKETFPKPPLEITVKSPTTGRSSIDSPRGLHLANRPTDTSANTPGPTLRKLGSSRSFTDLRSARVTSALSPPAFNNQPSFLSPPAFLKRTHSTDSVNFASLLDAPPASGPSSSFDTETTDVQHRQENSANDAQVMKTRSSQKSFVLVRISSLHLLLSVVKEGSFECHDAKIKTRELEYRNQTWSFEELVNQFIPSNMSWRGWVKMAFHQPLVPVLPVARELLAKTKWTASSKANNQPHDNPLRLLHPRLFTTDDDRRLGWVQNEVPKKAEGAPKSAWRNALRSNRDSPLLTSLPLTAEPESIDTEAPSIPDPPPGRKRVKSLFSKKSRQSSKSRGPENRHSEDILKGS